MKPAELDRREWKTRRNWNDNYSRLNDSPNRPNSGSLNQSRRGIKRDLPVIMRSTATGEVTLGVRSLVYYVIGKGFIQGGVEMKLWNSLRGTPPLGSLNSISFQFLLGFFGWCSFFVEIEFLAFYLWTVVPLIRLVTLSFSLLCFFQSSGKRSYGRRLGFLSIFSLWSLFLLLNLLPLVTGKPLL